MIQPRADVVGQDDSHTLHTSLKSHAKADTVRLLIDHGADVFVRDETHSTSLHLASSLGSAETAAADRARRGCHCTRWQSQDAFTSGVVSGQCRDCATLDPARTDVNGQDEGLVKEKDNWRQKPLRRVKSDHKADTVQLLIRHGADVTARDDTHSTPLHLASSKWSVETVELLIQHGADLNAQNGNQSTPLHLAASSHLSVEGNIVRLLLKHDANIDAKDSEGRTPLQIASSVGHYWIAKLLSDRHAGRG